MPEPLPQRNAKVTLEQLIQLKRSEKPPAVFWEDFDRDLHRRQLASLVKVDPWYRRTLRSLSIATRRLAPAGAGAAAIALVVLAVQRVDTTNPATEPGTASAGDLENKIILLPEEAITVSGDSARPAPPPSVRPEFHGHVRAAPQALATGVAAARRFTTVAAPVTFSTGNDASAITSANALTAGTVLRSLAATAPESL